MTLSAKALSRSMNFEKLDVPRVSSQLARELVQGYRTPSLVANAAIECAAAAEKADFACVQHRVSRAMRASPPLGAPLLTPLSAAKPSQALGTFLRRAVAERRAGPMPAPLYSSLVRALLRHQAAAPAVALARHAAIQGVPVDTMA